MWCGDRTTQTRSRDRVRLCVIILQPCAGKSSKAGGRESWGLLACSITAVLCEWMSQLLSLSILFCWVEVMRTERVARDSTRRV